jgi:Methyltransferase domain
MDGRTEKLERDLAALRTENAELRELIRENRGLLDVVGEDFPPGHFHSPYPSPEDVHRFSARVWGKQPPELPAIHVNPEGQLDLLEQLSAFHDVLPFPDHPEPPLRYFFENRFYGYGDAAVLFAMIRHLEPERIIEIGSGFSSAVVLDTNERFFGNAIDCTFIDPHPHRFLGLVHEQDLKRSKLMRTQAQDVDLETFQSLQQNDILFIDSSHVSKFGSDVNYLFFEVLPALTGGVYVHVHDIFYPFDYPRRWVEERRWAWNEAYLLRAFLQYNTVFEICFFNDYLFRFHTDAIERMFPTMLKNSGGSIWLRRRAEG